MAKYTVTSFGKIGDGSCCILPRSCCGYMSDREYTNGLKQLFSSFKGRWVSMSFLDERNRALLTYKGVLKFDPMGWFIYDTAQARCYGPMDYQISEAKLSEVRTGSAWTKFHHIELEVPNPETIVKKPIRELSHHEWLQREYALRSIDHFVD